MWHEVSWHLSRRKCRRNFFSYSQSLHRISREGKKEVMNKIGSRFDNENEKKKIKSIFVRSCCNFTYVFTMRLKISTLTNACILCRYIRSPLQYRNAHFPFINRGSEGKKGQITDRKFNESNHELRQ